MKSLFPLFLITTLLFISCKDDDTVPTVVQLSPMTSEGLNTFGCRVNGEVWVAMTPNSVENELDVLFDKENSFLTLQALIITNSRNEFFSFAVSGIAEIGDYEILEKDIFAPIEIYTNFNNSKTYIIDTTSIQFFNLNHLDLDLQVISGTFEFTLVEKNGSDTLHVTEGRIDAQYRN